MKTSFTETELNVLQEFDNQKKRIENLIIEIENSFNEVMKKIETEFSYEAIKKMIEND